MSQMAFVFSVGGCWYYELYGVEVRRCRIRFLPSGGSEKQQRRNIHKGINVAVIIIIILPQVELRKLK